GDRAGREPDAAGGPAGAGRDRGRPAGVAGRLGPVRPRQRHAAGREARPRRPAAGPSGAVPGGDVGGAAGGARAGGCRAGGGKRAKVVLVAVARKLLVIANAVIRSGRPWEPELARAR